jgi:acetyl-CoA acyltransferase 2
VTAGNASGICDGAAALVLASEEAVKAQGLTPLARVAGFSSAGVDPSIMGFGPVPAIQSLLAAAGITMGDVGMFEINEAFAPQALAVQKALDIADDKLNIHGGAIAIGHPLGASGARILAHIAHSQKHYQKYAVGSACIGGGMGMAVLLERV